MHNSNNPAVGKVIFTSTLLAQAKLLGITADTNNPNPHDLQEQIEADTQAKISIIPRFSEAKSQNGNVPVELINYMARKSKELNAEFDKVELELLAKADEYQIPYNKKCIDWHELEDKICEFESIIEEADEWLIEWHYFGYDPIGIQDEIERKQELQREGLILDRLAGYGGGYAYWLCCMNRRFDALPLSPKSEFMRYA